MAKAKVYALTVANGALLEAPAFESHYRGSNWLAVIDIDGSAPGGLSRRFLNRGKGECLYLIEQLALFDAVEFGADYTTSMGNKQRYRWYGVVVAKTDSEIHVEEASSGAKAVLRSKQAQQSIKDRAAALKTERDALVKRAADLEREIQELTIDAESETGSETAVLRES
jgi:hypothetical protein